MTAFGICYDSDKEPEALNRILAAVSRRGIPIRCLLMDCRGLLEIRLQADENQGRQLLREWCAIVGVIWIV